MGAQVLRERAQWADIGDTVLFEIGQRLDVALAEWTLHFLGMNSFINQERKMIEHRDLRRNVTSHRLLSYKSISEQKKTIRNEQNEIYFFKLFPRMNFILLIVNLI